MKNLTFSFLFIFVFLIFVNSADAHKVSVYAYREGDSVLGECYFARGFPCKNSKVEVYDSRGRKIMETSTDEKGKFSFKTKETGQLRIVIQAGQGHRAEYKLEAAQQPEKILASEFNKQR